MSDLPAEIKVWFSRYPIDYMGTWATTRYPAEAVTYVPKADAEAAVALALEEAAENKEQLEIWAHEILAGLAFADVLKIDSYNDKIEAHDMVGRGLVEVIRALAPADGLAAVDALRERAAKAEQERDAAVRGRNDWRDDFKALAAAIVGDTGLSAMTVAAQARTFRPRAEKAEADRDRLAAELAAANAREAGLRNFVEDFAAAKIDALRFPRPLSPEDELDPVVEAEEVWAWQADARAALAQAPAPTEEG